MKLKKYQEDTLSAIKAFFDAFDTKTPGRVAYSAFYLDEDERTRFVGRGAWQARLEY